MSSLPLGSCELTELPRVLLVGVDCLSFQVYESHEQRVYVRI